MNRKIFFCLFIFTVSVVSFFVGQNTAIEFNKDVLAEYQYYLQIYKIRQIHIDGINRNLTNLLQKTQLKQEHK